MHGGPSPRLQGGLVRTRTNTASARLTSFARRGAITNIDLHRAADRHGLTCEHCHTHRACPSSPAVNGLGAAVNWQVLKTGPVAADVAAAN